MLVSQQREVQDEIRELIRQHGRTRAALLPVLQEIQRKHSLVSDSRCRWWRTNWAFIRPRSTVS